MIVQFVRWSLVLDSALLAAWDSLSPSLSAFLPLVLSHISLKIIWKKKSCSCYLLQKSHRLKVTEEVIPLLQLGTSGQSKPGTGLSEHWTHPNWLPWTQRGLQRYPTHLTLFLLLLLFIVLSTTYWASTPCLCFTLSLLIPNPCKVVSWTSFYNLVRLRGEYQSGIFLLPK